MAGYDLLFHVPILDTPKADGIRATDPSFQRAVDQRLGLELERRQVTPAKLDPSDRENWLDIVEKIVWQRLAPPQLELL